ncbi:hypothetical protein EDD21DRAFT_361722 [Dissophora ornata]|nr:hypothetical protein EDD21DRAFT_361722 [Dissophora ornata]
MPQEEDFVSLGVMCLKYLVLGILSLLNPSPPSTRFPEKSVQVEENMNSLSPVQTKVLAIGSAPGQTQWSDRAQNLASGILPSQRNLLNPIHIYSIHHLTRVLCFLPLLGRHFNNLPTSTFIDTFLDRSEGDLPIDRAAVMVYGFICVLDLETGKANFASESYKIFERSMPTHGVVQAQEIIRIVERHRWLMRGFLLSSPTFSSSRLFGDDARL